MSSSGWENIFQEEDEEFQAEEEEFQNFLSNKDCIIFLIDSSKGMFEPNDQGEIPFHNAIKCAIATITDKIISSENDLIGICFYGTKKKKNPNEFEGIYVFMDVDVPDAQKIIDLEGFLKKPDLRDSLGHFTGDFPFCDALWTCSTMFSLCSVKVAHKRVFLFTNEDNPNSTDEDLRNKSFQRAKDLAELGIDIELFSMNKPSNPFDPTLFYQYIISFPEDEETGNLKFDASSKFEELRSRVRRKEFKKRSLVRIPFFIGDTEFAVRLYSLVQETKKSSHIWTDAKTGQPIKTMTKWVCEDTGTLLMDSQIKYGYPYGGEKIIFEKDEITQIKNFDKQGIKLMGFKPRSSLKDHHNIRNASFIYPDEQIVKGSTVLFATLLDRMLTQDKIAICKMTPRVNSQSRFVALYPQAEVLDEEGIQTTPPGFHVIYLPYTDDIRPIRVENVKQASLEQVVKAKKVVKTMRFKFDSSDFENPSLQKHYASLQAIALEKDQVEDIVDYVNPDEEGITKYGDIIQQKTKEFKDAVFSPGYDPLAPMLSKKRKAADDNNTRPAKKAAIEVTDEDIVESIKDGTIGRFTAQQLKKYLTSHGQKLSSKYKKDDLVTLAIQYCQYACLIDISEEEIASIVALSKKKPKTSKKAISKSSTSKKKSSATEESIEEDEEEEGIGREEGGIISEEEDEEEEEESRPPPKKSQSGTSSLRNSSSSVLSDSSLDVPITQTVKPLCMYGVSCYRKNPQHFRDFRHPPELEQKIFRKD